MAKKLSAYREKFERHEATREDADQAKVERRSFNEFVEARYQEGIFGEDDVNLLYGVATGEMLGDFSLYRAIKEGRDHPTIRFVRDQGEKYRKAEEHRTSRLEELKRRYQNKEEVD